jgi:hypothetical protein
MTFPRGHPRSRLAPAAVLTAALAVVLPGLAGCAGGATTSAPGEPTPAAGCGADYCAPANWDTARASAPLRQIPAFVEPLNVVISARSDVSLSALQQALGDWDTVATSTTVSVSGIRIKCISSEQADVTGQGFAPQAVAWRLGGCTRGNALSLTGDEDHVRIWNQPVRGSRYGAWFITASYETLCLVKNGKLVPAATDARLAALDPGGDYHCVDGGPGSYRTRHPDGYDDGARTFAADIAAAAHGRGWTVSQRIATVPRAGHSGEGGVPFTDDVYVLTITKPAA